MDEVEFKGEPGEPGLGSNTRDVPKLRPSNLLEQHHCESMDSSKSIEGEADAAVLPNPDLTKWPACNSSHRPCSGQGRPEL